MLSADVDGTTALSLIRMSFFRDAREASGMASRDARRGFASKKNDHGIIPPVT